MKTKRVKQATPWFLKEKKTEATAIECSWDTSVYNDICDFDRCGYRVVW